MGILRYFKWIYDEYPECLAQISENAQVPFRPDYYAIDLNALIHPVCKGAVNNTKDNGTVQMTRLLVRKKASPQQMYVLLINELRKLIKFVNPRRGVIIAIDGVAPCSNTSGPRRRSCRQTST